ncbi:AfsR/SARP family transcriptional regulator [Nocardioides daeguensis]|uniref:AfsR/SARP family transcriptional regulator n=1 Tax=Nocardioides daeguensis TaxID=908359 RepID=UPI001C478D1C|nr:BTAD domain-containing putative transcriptional regulator [Nocardioides daeguensis]MBV6729319.1 winged helix-turn-helix domain-containing protein [Nocardioides daeguensis]MCR1774295.1 winged helix-turn-helix domain-containing protein [Nocardioides daeguensis]
MPDRGDSVPLRLLGPLEVLDRTGASVDIGSPRHRETLAALAVDAGRVVSTDTLLDRVWGESARGGTLANLQAVISRLRARLRDAGVPAEIATAPPGYRLDLPAGALDTHRLAAGIDAARTALAAADPQAAQHHLADALGWWRGEPLADVPQPFARTEALRLEGLRLTGEELAAELDVTLGRAGAAVARLTGLARQHPLRESVRGQLMRALYLAGRQADALEEYADLRAQLVEELGVDPGPAVQRLHQQILEQDPALRPGPVTPPVQPAASPRRPHRPSAIPSTDLLGPLIGRERDVAHLVDVLRSPTSRVVTVTGVGGCGKTRLALAVAAAAETSFADGVSLVPLAPLHDPSAVIPAIARAVGVAEGGNPFTALLDLLRDQDRLLLLDNAEHLLDAWPEVATLAAACPELRILVTSRIPLRVRGEVLFPLTPLDLPAATELFVTRAATTGAAGLPAADDPVVGQLCHRLAGIPLAIELAAARVRLLPPAEILARLDEVMAAEGARDLPPRQRTMRSAIDWSFALLSPLEQAAFPRLAVFRGGFGIDAAAAVLEDLVAPNEVLALLESLVDQSLVVVAPGPRFRLLEPVAQYAATRLSPDAERAARDAHLRYFDTLAARHEPSLRGEGTVETLAEIELEHANLVAAVEWSLASGQADLGGWLGWRLWLFWWIRGALREGRRLMQAVLAHEVSDPVRVRAGSVVGALAFAQGDDVDAEASWSASADLARRTGDREGLPYAYGGIGLVALARDDTDLAARVIEENIGLCEEAGLGGEWLWTLCHVWLGTVELLRGNPTGAGELVDLALAAARRRHDPLAVYIALFTAIQVSMAQGEPERARRQIAEGVLLSRDTGDHANLAYLLDALAVVESLSAGDLARVGVLLGAAAQLRAGTGGNVYGYYRPDESLIEQASKAARAARGDSSYDADVAAGRALDVEAMVALATG